MDEEHWGARLARKKALVLFVPGLAIGRAAEFFDGTTRRRNGANAPVLAFEEGHVFFADREEKFVELDPALASFFAAYQAALTGMTSAAALKASAGGIDMDRACDVIVAALRAQATALKKGA